MNRAWRAVTISSVILLVVIILLSIYMIWPPSPRQRRVLVQRVLHTPANQITSILILPSDPRNGPSLVSAPVVILNRQEIERLDNALGATGEFLPNHPVAKWYAILRLVTLSGKIEFGVESTSDNGTFVSIMTKVDHGWNVGEFRNDTLGASLEKIIAAHE